MITVYKYGAVAPADQDNTLAEMRRRNDLWNNLVEIERKISARWRDITSEPEARGRIETLNAEIDALVAEINRRRQAQRTKQVDVADLRQAIKEKKQARKALTEAAKQTRAALREERKHLLDALEGERRAAVKAAAAASGCWWCNYEDVVQSYEVARVKAMREGAELHFHRWAGEGKLAVRYQTGLSVEETSGLSDLSALDSEEEGESETDGSSEWVRPRVGDLVQWESQGILKLPSPKRVAALSDDGSHAFLEGSMTGVPISELIIEERPAAPAQAAQLPAAMMSESGKSARYMLGAPAVAGSDFQRDVWNLEEGPVTIQWPKLTAAESYESLFDWLETLKRKLKREAKKAGIEVGIDG